MTDQEIVDLLHRVRMAPAGGGRAVHKPLLLLFWFARIARNEPRLARFSDVEAPFRQLLVEFGSSNSPNTRHLPFWHLNNDAQGRVWNFLDSKGVPIETNGASPGIGWFRSTNPVVGLTPDLDHALRTDDRLRQRIAMQLLTEHFPETLHADIASQLGMEFDPAVNASQPDGSGRRRNPRFRDLVLRAYEYRCCICGFDLRIGNVSAGLEAAHIRWFTADGPDVECNGMAMCALHHKIFDLGAFTVEPKDLTIVFSQNIQLGDRTRASLLSHHGAGIILPQSKLYMPAREYLDWHASEVFKEPRRA